MNIFHHTGDLGDIVASLPVLCKLGGGKLVISDASFPLGHGPRESLRGKRFEALAPLAAAAPCVSEITWEDKPQGITHDVASFRSILWKPCETLTQWQGRYFDLQLPAAPEPWLHIENPKMHNKIVIGRTHRYHTSFFPWRLIIDQYGDDILFLGLREEYLSFASSARRNIEWHPTTNLLDAAEVIAGSRLFIGGQSVLFWIAAGLGHPLVQETHEKLYTRNSIVPRDNAYYSDHTENLGKVYDLLKLDKVWLKRFPVPAPKINLSTSAQDLRKNLSTSAEIFTAVNRQNEDAISRADKTQGYPSPSFA